METIRDLFHSELVQHITSVFGISILGIILYLVVFRFIKTWAQKKEHYVAQLLQKHVYFPGLLLFFIITLHIGLPLLRKHFTVELYDVIQHTLAIALIISIALLLLRNLSLFYDILVSHYQTSNPQDYSLRKVKTQYQLIQRVINVIIVVVAVGAVLMTFAAVRKFSTTLLASAGVVGIILGIAAQKSLGTLLAGIQIAITQPIRLDDTIVVGKDNGTVSEITLTYVVVNTGDGRRLIVPINYFIDQAFENWSRNSPEMIGKVKLYMDYSLPVEDVRAEFKRLLESTELWDKRSSTFLVTAADNKTIELTATMSARNNTDSSALECFIREKLVGFVQHNYPGSLPLERWLGKDN